MINDAVNGVVCPWVIQLFQEEMIARCRVMEETLIEHNIEHYHCSRLEPLEKIYAAPLNVTLDSWH